LKWNSGALLEGENEEEDVEEDVEALICIFD
jgi:hypothetical protein